MPRRLRWHHWEITLRATANIAVHSHHQPLFLSRLKQATVTFHQLCTPLISQCPILLPFLIFVVVAAGGGGCGGGGGGCDGGGGCGCGIVIAVTLVGGGHVV